MDKEQHETYDDIASRTFVEDESGKRTSVKDMDDPPDIFNNMTEDEAKPPAVDKAENFEQPSK